MKRSPEPETEGLLAGIRLAEKNLSRKSFRGSSAEQTVGIKLHGDLSPKEIKIEAEAFDLSPEQAEALALALQEALGRAIENAQRAASRFLEEELGQRD